MATLISPPVPDTAETTAEMNGSRPTSQRQLDESVARVREGAPRFAALPLDERCNLVRAMRAGYMRIARASVEAACVAKGITLGTPLEGEEWTLGPWFVVRHLRLIEQSLLAIKRTDTTPRAKIAATIDGRLAVRVFPASTLDGLLFAKMSVDIHMQRGVTEPMLDSTRAEFYRRPDHSGRVVLVLGAGNVNGIVSQDVITKMFNEGKACVVKMNPVNSYCGAYLESAFADAIRRGALAVVYGGADEGDYLVRHPGIDEIHITGSDKTFDQIVWGAPGVERDRRKADGQPLIRKPITAELGNVSPVLVVPGPYTDRELQFQAEDVASALTYNASFDCNAAKVIITGKWLAAPRCLHPTFRTRIGHSAPSARVLSRRGGPDGDIRRATPRCPAVRPRRGRCPPVDTLSRTRP